ncbi:putative glutathione-specific gamma-glutamylcyclotransferase 2 [Agrilus planipennis]|uniref:glutathione-specific gamma-glutamylcyclotransferase n=1 Tax=Agrilus planipennis TaxID=224129 RepID=A0A1W4XC28_AGRPL|nr:putative glutathione-specific gamma-glutamylcyclotransferase 2 [Agrilus planipennis]
MSNLAGSSSRGLVVPLQESIEVEDTKFLWVFGYGSLCWNPGFTFDKAVAGCIRGFSRRFWQGNSTHRGTEQQPGRVATLVEDNEGVVHGVAFRISGDAAIPYLTRRECKLGGYKAEFTSFFPSNTELSFTVVLYVATSRNAMWLGDAPLQEIALQISNCQGPSGHNAEYLIRLAEFMREHFPEEKDEHLFHLEVLVKKNILNQNKCLTTLMGDSAGHIIFVRSSAQLQRPEGQEERAGSFQFTTRVPEKTLRCLNI